jgi:hypothetical protein
MSLQVIMLMFLVRLTACAARAVNACCQHQRLLVGCCAAPLGTVQTPAPHIILKAAPGSSALELAPNPPEAKVFAAAEGLREPAGQGS